MKRRIFLSIFMLGALPAMSQEKVIRVTARKFEFTPSEIELKLGEPVVLELATEDIHMGFDAPELGLHADLVPGKTVRLPFTPGKAGKFEFACDVFCGSGHEDMGGIIKVA